MAFEPFTRELLARADEARDPGSGDAYLRLSYASETTVKGPSENEALMPAEAGQA